MDSSRKSAPDAGWLQQAGARARAFWPEKMFGTILGMAVFFTVYFWLLRHPLFPLTTIPFTFVDRWIRFQPAALPLYLSLWLYVSLAPALLSDRRELVSYGLAAFGLSVIGFGIFLFWPTKMPWPPADWAPSSLFAFLKSVDASANACPSMHAAFAMFTAIWFERLLRQMSAGRFVRALNWLWCLGILYSTIAVRQHVSIDIFAGAVLGAGVAAAHLRLLSNHG